MLWSRKAYPAHRGQVQSPKYPEYQQSTESVEEVIYALTEVQKIERQSTAFTMLL